MKSALSTFGVLLMLGNAVCQKIAIENHRNQVVYPAIDFPLTVVVEDLPCASLFLTTDNGKIKGSGCDYQYIAEWVGNSKVFIHQIKGRDTVLLGEKTFYVKSFPPQTAKIGNQSSGKMKEAMLKAQRGLIIPVDGFDITAKIPVNRFQMRIIRANESIAFVENQGGAFNDAASVALSKIKHGDKVIFNEIYAFMPGMKAEEKMNTIEIEVE
jgi:GldM C-terminal domain